jgi:hypothetical protein
VQPGLALRFLDGNHRESIRFPNDTPASRALWFVEGESFFASSP